ncbi:MAG: N-6 DNA methylase [Kiritimatiellae bacterium]|nr:N-6 DNA methylase [Kiritimatiellia bacterium]
MSIYPDTTEKILSTLLNIERRHTTTPYISAVFGAFCLYLSRGVPKETPLASILEDNHIQAIFRYTILDRLEDHWKEYRPFLTRFWKDDLSDFIREAVAGEKYFGGKNAGWVSSGPIVELAIRLLDLKPGDSVCDLGCATGDFIRRAYDSVRTSKGNNFLVGIERSADAATLAKIRMICERDTIPIEIRKESVFSQASRAFHFDKVFCDPPSGLRGLPQDPDVREMIQEQCWDFPPILPSMTGEWIFAARVIAAMSPGGRAIVLMSPSALSDSIGEPFRRYFVQKKLIDAVVELPPRLFSHSKISPCMVIFSENNESIKMVSADKLGDPNLRQNIIDKQQAEIIAACVGLPAHYAAMDIDCYRKLVPTRDILKRDCCLLPKRYFSPPVVPRNGIPLSELVKDKYIDFKRGATIASKELDEVVCEKETDCLYITSGDISDGVLPPHPTYLRKLSTFELESCARPGDIIITRVQASEAGFKAAVVDTSSDKKVLPNGNLLVVTVDPEKADPFFVKACIDSEYGQRYLSDNSTGTAVKAVSLRTIEEFPIPKLSLTRQREIGKICRENIQRVIELRNQLAAAQAELSNVFASHAANCLVKTETEE